MSVEWKPGTLRVDIASKIVGHIFTQPNAVVGPATMATRERGLKQADEIIAAVVKAAADVVGNMRQSEAGLFDAKHSGQRGCDRSDALYDAYHAVLALSKETRQ